MSDILHYAFVDESGTAAPFSGSRFLVIALLCIANPRPIELHVRRVFKRYGTNLASGEIKAAVSREVVVTRLLQVISQESVAIIAVVVDKQGIARPPAKSETIYRVAISLAIRRAVTKWLRLDICLDKRYTTPKMRYKLEREIRESVADFSFR